MDRRGRDRFPINPVFESSFSQKEFYANDPVCMYVLKRLAKVGRQESAVNVEGLTIEHVMPQKLSEEWRRELGSNHDGIHEVLHRIGNLTLTEDNSSLGNRSFIEKRRIYAKSVVKMTRALKKHQKWTEDEITSRSKDLAEEASVVWPYPPGHRPHLDNDDDDAAREQEYLDETGVEKELWDKLKASVLDACPGAIFTMRSRYAIFKLKIPNSDRVGLFCSVQALKHQIYVVYNTAKEEGVISATSSVDDLSNLKHLCVGDFRSTVYDEDDVPAAVDLAKKVWHKKKGG